MFDNLTRRMLLKSAGAALAYAGMARSAWAQEEPVVVYGSPGGIVEDVMREVIFTPFTEATGIEVRAAPLPNLAKIQAMVQTNTVDVDLWEADGKEMLILAERGLLQPVDYAQLAGSLRDDLIEGAAAEYGISNILWGAGIVYGRDRFSGAQPQNWADFWNVEKFPGARTLSDAAYQVGPLEAALLADGVSPDQLYPLDVDRAFATLDRIKPHIVKFWATSSEGLNLVVSGNATVGMNTFGRIITMKHRGEDPGIDIQFNQGLVKRSFFCMPKGAKHVGNAHRFMDFFFTPENQAAFINAYPAYGYTNTKAASFLTPQTLEQSIANPERMKNLIIVDDGWWAQAGEGGKTNYEIVLAKWLEWVSR